jgi:hypothetical protein
MSRDEEHEAIARGAVSRLRHGGLRLSVAPIGGIETIWKPPHFIEWDDQDYGRRTTSETGQDIIDQYVEEIEAIESLLNESVHKGGLQTLQDVFREVGDDKYARDREIARYARQFWCEHAIPIRFRRGRVCVVWPPEDYPMHLPIVHEYSPAEFITSAANAVLDIRKELEIAKKNLAKWKTIGAGSLFLLVLVVLCFLRLLPF